MNPIATGDPSFDGLMNWLTSGGSLQSPGAILGLGALIKLGVIPLLTAVANRWNWKFTGATKLHIVFLSGAATAIAVGYITKSHLTVGDTIMLGGQAALTAIGIHETVATTKKATAAMAPLVEAVSSRKRRKR